MNWQAYNLNWAFHTALRARAARWQRRQLLSPAQLAAIEAAYPLPYYRPVWPLRVGLFIFTWLGLASALGLFTLLSEAKYPVALCLVACLGCFGTLELLIQQRRFYYAGTDNALLYAALGAAGGLIYYVAKDTSISNSYDYGIGVLMPNATLLLALVLGLLLLAAVRYADALVAAGAFVAAVALAGLLVVQIPAGVLFVPFLAMGAAGAALLGHRVLARHLTDTPLADYYATCLLTVKVLALTTFYLGGNYLVLRESPIFELFSGSLRVVAEWGFGTLTAAIPLLYIVLGLRRADRAMLLLGLLALAFSLFTLRHYRSLMPSELAAALAGTVLTVAAGALLRYLRPERFGLTSLPDDEPRHFNLENLVQAQTAHAPTAPAGSGFEFGGGQSGGGGATGQF